jgi:hypothetical protein
MPPPLVLQVAEFTPDQPEFAGGGSRNILNVYPRTKASYGPVNAPAPTAYGALNGRCQGAAAYVDATAAVHIFAGSASDLFSLKAGLSSWANVSKASAAYNVSSTDQWQFVYFNGRVIATNLADPIQTHTLGSIGSFTDLSVSAPRAKHIAVVKNSFVVVANTYDTVNGSMPQRVWWSAAGDATNWPTLGTSAAAQVQSNAVDLLGDGGWVMAITPSLVNADAAVFQQNAVRRMQYVGPPEVFAFIPVEGARGMPTPYAVVVYGGVAYYLGQDGFYAFDGAASQPIGFGRVDRWFWTSVDISNLHRVVATADPLNRLIWWALPGPGNSDGNPNYLLCYNIMLDRWAVSQITCETIVRLLSIGYTLEELNTVLGYAALADLPAPLDSPMWQGGRLQMGVFDTSHRLNFLTGPALAATVETNEIQPVSGRRTLVRSARPFIDGAPTPTIAIGRRDRLVDNVVYGPDIVMNALGTCPQRLSGRYLRATIKIPVGTAGAGASWEHLSGIELDGQPQGVR